MGYMQNKRLVLILGGLAVATLLITTAFGPNFYGFRSMMRGPATETMPMQKLFPGEGAGYGAAEPGLMMDQQFARDISSTGFFPPYYPPDDALYVDNRVTLRSANFQVIHRDVSAYMNSMKEFIESVDGRVLSYSTNSFNRYNSGYLYAKVPLNRFDETNMRAKEGVRKIVQENVSVDDITGQVVNQEEQIKRLESQIQEKEIELAGLNAGTPDYRRVQLQIETLERQLEQARSAQGTTAENTQFAAISISAADSERYYNPGVPGDFRGEFEAAWESLKETFLKLGVFAVWIAVYAVIWLPLVLLVRWVWNRFRR